MQNMSTGTSQPASSQVDKSSLQSFLSGCASAVGVPVVTIFISMMGVGGLARQIDFPVIASTLSTLVVWAGPAQVLLFGGVSTGTALPWIALAILFSSLRFMPMTMSLLPYLNDPKKPTWMLLLAAHLVSITTWVEGLRHLPGMPPRERMPFYLGSSAMIIGVGTIATGVGYLLVSEVPAPLAAALLFTTPLYFGLSTLGAIRTPTDALPVILATILTPTATALLGRDYDLIAAGLSAGVIGYLVDRIVRRRRLEAAS
jgi:predicted branched-subunit amino acid permease